MLVCVCTRTCERQENRVTSEVETIKPGLSTSHMYIFVIVVTKTKMTRIVGE